MLSKSPLEKVESLKDYILQEKNYINIDDWRDFTKWMIEEFDYVDEGFEEELDKMEEQIDEAEYKFDMLKDDVRGNVEEAMSNIEVAKDFVQATYKRFCRVRR